MDWDVIRKVFLSFLGVFDGLINFFANIFGDKKED